MKKVKILFLGTPKFASLVLEELIKAKYDVVGVITQPDKRIGRRHRMESPIVKKVAVENNIKVLQPEKIKDSVDEVLAIDFDLMITAAYGQFIPDKLLKHPKYGSFNLHGSLLPKYRGGAPIHHAIINGEKETGISLMHMIKEMDAGDYIAQSKTSITEEDTLSSLYKRMSEMAAKLLMDNIPNIVDNKYTNVKQDNKLVSFGLNIKSKKEYIEFNRPTEKVFNHIRGLDKIPGSYARYEGLKIKLFNVTRDIDIEIDEKAKPGEVLDITKNGLYIKTRDGAVNVRTLQKEGKGKLDIKDFINGNTLIVKGGAFNG
jgi:methionyl-tRNA formyltransferase